MRLTPELEAAARQLGSLLSESEPLKAYREAERRLDADAEALALLDRLQALEADLRARQSQGQPLSEDDINDLYRLQAEVGNHPTLRALFDAGADLRRYLQEINRELSLLLGLDFAQLGYSPLEHNHDT